MPDSSERFRAFAALWWLQPQRLADVRTPGALALNLDQLLAHGEPVVDAIGQLAQKHFDFFLVATPWRERLFFTEVGSFPLPFVGGVALALPLSPHHFCTFVRKEVHDAAQQIRGILDTRLMISTLSIGVGNNVRRVLMPPEVVPHLAVDEAQARAELSLMRESSRRLVDLMGEASQVAGLSAYHVTYAPRGHQWRMVRAHG
jgi:hypothetical protein